MSIHDLKSILEQAPYRPRKKLGHLPGDQDVPLWSGQIIEVLGEHPYAWMIELFKKIPSARVGWMSEGQFDLCPIALIQEGIPLSRFLFLDQVPYAEGFNKISTLIKSGLFQLVVFEQGFFKVKADLHLRKLQLISEEYGVGLILRSLKPTSSFCIQIQVETGAHTHFIKLKGGGYGSS